ncbi:MAG: ribosome maturation factor RimP, partial [Oscillospiraceae bacterium]|nr:ribosome maturation factor RimP [Oscillospiraceae bacterium]
GSPGVERVLRTDEHYAACLGEVITVKLFKALDGAKEFVGTLSVAENDSITLEIDSQPLKLEKSAISKANVYYDFEN